MTNETCKKCGQEIREGELITGQAWNGDGGEHITCPEPIITPVRSSTGMYSMSSCRAVYELPERNPYLSMVARTRR